METILQAYNDSQKNQTANEIPGPRNPIHQYLQTKRWFDYRSKIEEFIQQSARKGKNIISINACHDVPTLNILKYIFIISLS